MTKRVLLFVFALTVLNVNLAQSQNSDGFFYELGSMAPDLELVNLENQRFNLSHLKGKPVIISLFATWCNPCMKELKFLSEKLAKKYDKDEIEILAIGYGHVSLEMEYFMEDHGFDFTHVPDYEKIICNQLAESGVPRVIVLDEEGRIIEQKAGFDERVMLALVDRVERMIK